MSTGEKIRGYCKEHNMTVSQFAEKAGVSVMAISYWSRGVKLPNSRSLLKLEAATGIPWYKWLEDEAA